MQNGTFFVSFLEGVTKGKGLLIVFSKKKISMDFQK